MITPRSGKSVATQEFDPCNGQLIFVAGLSGQEERELLADGKLLRERYIYEHPIRLHHSIYRGLH